MNWDFNKMYALFASENQDMLLHGKWGVERELHRVINNGNLALTPHPSAFGDKLKNKEITTDFSESQMELITPAFRTVEEVDQYLNDLYQKAINEVGEEFLWPLSMPPRLPQDDIIPIAQFDNSKEGQAAYIYRQGLANRYGKKMQMISGIHFNFSFGLDLLMSLKNTFGKNMTLPDFNDEIYFSVARNFLRYRWLLIYLFGASPSNDETYDAVVKDQVESIKKCCPECCNQYKQFATSLRVSRFGYTNPVNVRNSMFYNNRKEYIQGIRSLMAKKSRKFAKLPVQLNNNILQKDSEFYSTIRLKQITKAEESQIDALENRGVKYAEVRILDIDPYVRTGISVEQMHFLQVFMLFCLFEENKLLDSYEMNRMNKNHHLVALSGRKPNLRLNQLQGGKISLKEWGINIFVKLHKIAILLDHEANGFAYSSAVESELKKLNNIALLPSSIIQEEMSARNESFLEFGVRKAEEYKEQFYIWSKKSRGI